MATIPSLALIPSGYKASKVYSVLPTDGTGDFTFTRSGNATRVNSDGLIELVGSNIPRLNYPLIDGVVNGCPHHILEPARTNNITYSNDFLDASWLPTDLTVSGGVISPDGTANAFTISNTATSGIIQKAVSLTGLRTVSIFAKKGTHRYLNFGAYGGTDSYANFDLENGVVSNGANAEIEDYGNGWYRCICHSADGTTGGVQIFPSNSSIGAGTTNGSIQIYAAQLESGSYATSYIPTQGATATRVAESCNGAGNSQIFNDSEGVLFAEISALANDSTYKFISVSNDTSSNRVSVFYGNASNVIRVQVIKDNVAQIDQSTSSYDITQYNKIALKYKQNDFVLWINGIKVLTDNLGDTPIGLIKLNFDEGEGSNDFYGNTKQIKYFNTALTDQELQALTSN